MPDKTDKAVIVTSAASGVAATTGGVMTGIGFTSSGIAATSTAAGMQAGIGNVVAGSSFAVAQSLGASGVFYYLGLTGGIGLAVGAVYGGYKLIQRGRKNPNK